MSSITITQDVAQAARLIRAGRLVAFPSGTSYGLAADTQQGWALQRLRNLKMRPATKTFTVFMRDELWDKFLLLRDEERRLLNKMAQQPLTLLVRPAKSLAHLVHDDLIGLRVIDHPLMEQFAQAVGTPLTATSANRSGEPVCFSPDDIERAFANPLPKAQLHEDEPRGASGTTYDLSLAAILDGGLLPPRPPTTIARLDGIRATIIRPGSLKF